MIVTCHALGVPGFAAGILKTARVYEAMVGVDRGDFAPEDPYGDHPVPIGTASNKEGEACLTHCRVVQQVSLLF